MNDELPVVIESTRAGFVAYSPFYPDINGRGRSQDEAVAALFAAIHKQESGSRSSTPPVTHVEIRFRESH